MKKAKVYSESDNILRIKLNDRTGVPAGSEYVIENSILIAEMKAGQSIELEI